MRKVVFALLVAALTAAPAMAELSHPGERTGPIIEAIPTPIGQDLGLRGTAVYDSMGPGTGGYYAGATGVGILGMDDYGTISGVNLTSIRFVGGMTRATGTVGSAAVMWFEYYDPTTFGFLTSYGVIIDDPGWWIWTIDINSPPFVIPHSALFQIVANSTFTGGGAYSTTIWGLWFLTTTDALTVGSNSPYIGGGETTGGMPLIHNFRFDVPEPATLGLLGAGMLLVLRRRR